MKTQHWKSFIPLPTCIQDASTCHDDLCPLIFQGFCLGQVFTYKKKEHFGFHQNQLLPCYWSFQSCHLHIHQLGMRRQLFRNSSCPCPGSALMSCFHDPLNTYQRMGGGGVVCTQALGWRTPMGFTDGPQGTSEEWSRQQRPGNSGLDCHLQRTVKRGQSQKLC